MSNMFIKMSELAKNEEVATMVDNSVSEVKTWVETSYSPDWNAQEDEEGYIKNKPFYDNGDLKEIETICDTTLSLSSSGNSPFDWFSYNVYLNIGIKDGVKYNVKIGDEDHIVISYGKGPYALTDGDSFQQTNGPLPNGATFYLSGPPYSYNGTGNFYTNFDCTDKILVITEIEENIIKLDAKFIDTVQTTGNNAFAIMSQKAVTDHLQNINNTTNIINTNVNNLTTSVNNLADWNMQEFEGGIKNKPFGTIIKKVTNLYGPSYTSGTYDSTSKYPQMRKKTININIDIDKYYYIKFNKIAELCKFKYDNENYLIKFGSAETSDEVIFIANDNNVDIYINSILWSLPDLCIYECTEVEDKGDIITSKYVDDFFIPRKIENETTLSFTKAYDDRDPNFYLIYSLKYDVNDYNKKILITYNGVSYPCDICIDTKHCIIPKNNYSLYNDSLTIHDNAPLYVDVTYATATLYINKDIYDSDVKSITIADLIEDKHFNLDYFDDIVTSVTINNERHTNDINLTEDIQKIVCDIVKDALYDKVEINGYEFIDMGLSVKWATFNIGATKPEDYGWYFQWAGTKAYNKTGDPVSGGGPKVNYLKAGAPYYTNSKYSKYTTIDSFSSTSVADNKLILEPEDDAAHVHVGGKSRMPTKEECQELIDACHTEWIENYNDSGINGLLFISKIRPSKTLFFPASGSTDNTNWNSAGGFGYYWTSSVYDTSDNYSNANAKYLVIRNANGSMSNDGRSMPYPIRPVIPNVKTPKYVTPDQLKESTVKTATNIVCEPNTITDISKVPVTSPMCNVSISTDGTFGLDGTLTSGTELQVFIENAGNEEITITIPNSFKSNGIYEIKIPINNYRKINIVSIETNLYLNVI